MKKSILAFFLIIILSFSLFCLPASAYQLSGFEINAEGVYFASLDTGDVLYTKNADKKLYPASLTKIMTALVLLDNEDNLDGEIITISESAIRSLDGTDSSVGGLIIGEQITARQALYLLLMSSANECANAIAEHYGEGDISKFIDMMNAKAEELEMTGTHYANAHGLHDLEHYTTPHDVYVATLAAMEYEVFKEVVSTTRYKMPATNKQQERTLVTTNYLQDRNNAMGSSYYYQYASGVKTGYTDEAGRCLVSTASKNGYNYICVLMKSPVYNEKGGRVRLEFGDSMKLYDWAFDNFEYKTVVEADAPVAEAPVELCWDHDFVPLALEGGLSAIMPKDADRSTVQIKTLPYKESYDAPIKKGDILGTAEIYYAGELLGTVNLVAGASRESNAVLVFWRWLSGIFTSTAFKIILAIIVCIIVGFIVAVILMNRKSRKRRYRRGYKGYKKH